MDGPVTFVVFGDRGDGGPVRSALSRRIAMEQPALVPHTGDLACWNGTFQQLEDYYFSVYRVLMSLVPCFPVPGDHDYETRDALA